MKRIFILLLFVSFYTAIQAQPGTLDKSYGRGGTVVDQTSGIVVLSSAIQADNKVVVCGLNYYSLYFVLIRYNTDGAIDLSFGSEGMVKTFFDQYYSTDGWTCVQVQPDGKIVVAGTNYTFVGSETNYPPYDGDIALARFNADGTPDKTFGENGIVITNTGEYESAQAMALQPDGKIVLTGSYSLRGLGYDSRVLVVRYNKDGSLDNTFGGKGYVVHGDNGYDIPAAIAVQEDGKIVIGGAWGVNDKCLLLRYLSNGDIDKTFGTNGQVLTQIGSEDWQQQTFYSVAIDKKQRIIAAGLSNDALMCAARYNSDGSLDKSFDEDGTKVITFSDADHYDAARTILLLKDDRILLAGDAAGGANPIQNFAFACLQPDGAFDSSFGTGGKVTTGLGIEASGNHAVLQNDGKIVLAGSPLYNYPRAYSIARYNGYDAGKQPLMVRIKRWMLHHGISWQMQPNKDVRYYTVQRSQDGIIYKEIAKLSNKSQVDKYEDAAMLAGSSYYRLAAIGWDGSRTYSNTVLIDESAQVKVFPNPVRDNLQLQGLQSGKTNVSIVDLQGNVRSSSVSAGSNYSVSTSGLTPGNYLLKLQHNSTTTTQPFVKE